jgi:hypothetical protein
MNESTVCIVALSMLATLLYSKLSDENVIEPFILGNQLTTTAITVNTRTGEQNHHANQQRLSGVKTNTPIQPQQVVRSHTYHSVPKPRSIPAAIDAQEGYMLRQSYDNPPALMAHGNFATAVPQYRIAPDPFSFSKLRPRDPINTFGVDPHNPLGLRKRTDVRRMKRDNISQTPNARIPSTEPFMSYSRPTVPRTTERYTDIEDELKTYEASLKALAQTGSTRCTENAALYDEPVQLNVTEYIYAPLKSRHQGNGDPIRGDIHMTPIQSRPLSTNYDDLANYIMFRPAANAQMLRQGALNVIAGSNEASASASKLQFAFSGGATTTYGGVDTKTSGRGLYGHEVPGDVHVKSFV